MKYRRAAGISLIIIGLFFWTWQSFKSPVNLPVPQNPSPAPTTKLPPAKEPVVQARVVKEQQPQVSVPSQSAPAAVDNVSVALDTKVEGKIIAKNGKTYPLRVYKPMLTPNDPSSNQWWVGHTGLNAAWDIGAGSTPTTVAVIDTGFGLNHEEFANRWASNANEQGTTASQAASDLNCTGQGVALTKACNNIDDNYDGIVDNETGTTTKQNPSKLNCTGLGLALNKSCNNIDDDGNGLVDDVRGWDFANYDASVQAGQINSSGDGTMHGTMVSGVLAATGNNNKGIAGVNWTTKILPIQALDDESYGDTLTVARSVRYAADQNADVISLSLGADADDPYLREAVQYALDQGSIVVAAAGNDGCNCISYPARYPEVLAIGASNSSGNPASFSSYGSALDVMAPGSGMTTATWSNANQTSLYASSVAGTSFSTPFVSGVLALARSHQPGASWGELKSALLENTNHTALSDGNRTNNLGFGYVRVDNTLNRVTSPLALSKQYSFAPMSSSDALGSQRAYQCETGRMPAAPLYQLSKNGEMHFTVSDLQYARGVSNGWTNRLVGYSCVGLPTDTPSEVRAINLINEIDNSLHKSL